MVWRATTHVGVGIANGPKGTFVVANFHPVGNVVNPGYFAKNVIKQEGAETPSASSVDKEKDKSPGDHVQRFYLSVTRPVFGSGA